MWERESTVVQKIYLLFTVRLGNFMYLTTISRTERANTALIIHIWQFFLYALDWNLYHTRQWIAVLRSTQLQCCCLHFKVPCPFLYDSRFFSLWELVYLFCCNEIRWFDLIICIYSILLLAKRINSKLVEMPRSHVRVASQYSAQHCELHLHRSRWNQKHRYSIYFRNRWSRDPLAILQSRWKQSNI